MHVQGCDPSNYAKVHRKLKCPVPGCKEKLTSISTYTCKNCSSDVCLKHRFPSDHDCATRKGSQPLLSFPVMPDCIESAWHCQIIILLAQCL